MAAGSAMSTASEYAPARSLATISIDQWLRTHPRSQRNSFPAGEHFDRLAG
uniref:hypothetical protein n=1 Tax=Cupriavidus yeoncheonensis TaxID=1462994 RepID=UPI003F492B7B